MTVYGNDRSESMLCCNKIILPGVLSRKLKDSIGRCNPPGGVAKARTIQKFLRLRLLPQGRLNA